MTPKSLVMLTGARDTSVLTRNGDTRVTVSAISGSVRNASFDCCSFVVFFDGARMYPRRSSSHHIIGLLSVYAIFSSRYIGAAIQPSMRAWAVVRNQYRNVWIISTITHTNNFHSRCIIYPFSRDIP